MFCTQESSEAIEEAKSYIKSMELSSRDVKLIKSNNEIIVEAIRDII